MRGLISQDTRKVLLSDAPQEEGVKIPEPMWCHNQKSESRDCCWWHYVFYPNGGPEKNGIFHPMYKYEQEYLEALTNHRQVAVFKASKLGITEFTELWMLHQCYINPFFTGKEVMIVTGPNVDLAKDLIGRAKQILKNADLDFVDQGSYGFSVNGVRVRAYPSNNISAMRGQPKVAMVFGDEAAFFGQKDDSDVVETCERYVGSDGGWLVFVSTAGKEAAGFFYDILEDNNSPYKKIEMYYERGLEKDPVTNTSMYVQEFIDEAMKLRSFEREYCGVWAADSGDIFPQEALDSCSKEEYDIHAENDSYDRVIGVDPGYGSSQYGIVAMQKQKGKYIVLHAESLERSSYIDALKKVQMVADRFKIRKIFVDSSAPELIVDLRDKLGYNVNGIAFNVSGLKMLYFASDQVSTGNVMIHPMFKKLKKQLMAIKVNKKGLPDKTDRNPFDLGDAFLLALWYYKIGSGYIGVF